VPKTITHLLLGCVVTRQIWEPLLIAWNHGGWRSSADSDLQPGGPPSLGLLTTFSLVFWTIWCHLNDVVFNGAYPSVQRVLLTIREEALRNGSSSTYKGFSGC
ncbi:hypothetical protein BRADI_4g35246v3, partial [Brachypodium distachyon]